MNREFMTLEDALRFAQRIARKHFKDAAVVITRDDRAVITVEVLR